MQLSALEREICAIESSLAAYKSDMPIARLPPELLIKIFLHLKPSVDVEMPLTSWIQFTHVCAHWRRIAIECPYLWTTIHTRCLKGIPELLRRSGTSLLSISIPLSLPPLYRLDEPDEGQPRITMVARQSSRIVGLHLAYSNPGGYPGSLLIYDVYMPMPVLQRLSIKAVGNGDFVISPTLFGGSTPALQVLTLSHCTFSYPYMLPFMQGARLKELRLHHHNFHANGGDTKMGILEFLDQLHDLETFEWAESYGFHNGDEGPTRDSKSVHWPKLRTLEIRSTCMLAARLLEQLQIPASSQTTVTCVSSFSPISVSDYLQLLDVLRGIYPDITTAPFAAERKASRHLTVRALDGASAGGLLMLDLVGGVSDADLQPILAPLHCEEAFLYLGSSLSHKPAKMSSLLAALSRTCHVRLRCGEDSRAPMNTLCAMLSEKTVLPRLEKLSLYDMTVGTGDVDMHISALSKIVDARTRLEHIRFVNCTLQVDAHGFGLEHLRRMENSVQISWMDI